MYNHLSGKCVEKNPAYVVIECAGVGYFVNISLHTYSKLSDDEACKLFTHLHISEDNQALYGFHDEEERKLFRHLISVSGVGCNTARMMLSSISPNEIVNAIVNGSSSQLQAIKGIGEKTAQRIIIDLKNKFGKDAGAPSPSSPGMKLKEESLTALLTLGFAKSTAEKAIDQVIRSNQHQMNVEDVIKQALKNL